MDSVKQVNKVVFDAIKCKEQRQSVGLELIASKNCASRAILEAVGSVMTIKYAEGYCGIVYYGGCENVDFVEGLVIERLLSKAHITVNKNTISNKNQKPTITSGMRIDAHAVTIRGLKEGGMEVIADIICDVIKGRESAIKKAKKQVLETTKNLPTFSSELL